MSNRTYREKPAPTAEETSLLLAVSESTRPIRRAEMVEAANPVSRELTSGRWRLVLARDVTRRGSVVSIKLIGAEYDGRRIAARYLDGDLRWNIVNPPVMARAADSAYYQETMVRYIQPVTGVVFDADEMSADDLASWQQTTETVDREIYEYDPQRALAEVLATTIEGEARRLGWRP